jgi:transposase
MPKNTRPQQNHDEMLVSQTLLLQKNSLLERENVELKRQIAWFQKQIFGSKSERRHVDDNPHQIPLNGLVTETEPDVVPATETITYQRGKAKKQRPEECVNDSGLRFTADVPVEVIALPAPELQGPDADQYEVISTKTIHRLAQRPASYVVLRYELPVVKRKSTGKLINMRTPAAVFDQSIADVSFLVGLLTDKFLYHLPLYRQHQRLQQAGITLSRATLTNLTKRAIDLLRPIVEAQLRNILLSKVLAMDETPVKAGPAGKGKMKTAWYWPVYGQDDEIVFTYSPSRARQHIDDTLGQYFNGTLISDGYAAYARYAAQTSGVTHAQCWTHTRRQFVEAQTAEPNAVATALNYIGKLYAVEAEIEAKQLSGENKREYRLEHSQPVIAAFLQWCELQCQTANLLPDNPLQQAINYTLKRTNALKVFLEDPDVPLDTNHLERALRPIPMGRRNWLFCWTEIGAAHVGIIQSLICTCKLHDVDPYTYLVDVLQRVSLHPASDVASLTPRLWKEKFAGSPMRSDLYR